MKSYSERGKKISSHTLKEKQKPCSRGLIAERWPWPAISSITLTGCQLCQGKRVHLPPPILLGCAKLVESNTEGLTLQS